MNFPTAVKTCVRKYWNTDGRASRSEYWYWQLFVNLAGLLLAVPDMLIFPDAVIGPIGLTFTLLTLPPSLFVQARRLHDINRSGYWMLIAVTVIGIIPLLYWSIKPGTKGENDYGTDPLTGGNTGIKSVT